VVIMMANPSRRAREPATLYGRREEREALGQLLTQASDGQSGVLVVRGEAGIGKTALLDHIVAAAADLRVIQAAGTESEMELAFAALHRLCAPVLDRLGRLPGPQRDALQVVFGREQGAAPDRFLVGLAVLSLLTEAAAEHPLVCVIDDAQWLDQASAQVLAFAARRLRAESVLMVFALPEPGRDLAGLPELEVSGLRDADARAVLASVVWWPLEEEIRARILAEARGNPQALLEVPWTQLAAGFGGLDAQPRPGRTEQGFLWQLDALPAPTRLLLVTAAAEPTGDSSLVWRAAARLAIPAAAAHPAAQAGLIEFGTRVAFRHPLMRSAAYRSASLRERREVHDALAEVTDPLADPDRRAWHRAQAAPGPDELVAAELEREAGRAQARGGLAAAATFLEQAAALTPDPARRAERALTGAHAQVRAGAAGTALELLALAESGTLDPFQRAQAGLVRAQLAFACDRGGDASPLLLEAARRLDRHDVSLARATYLDAVHAAMFAGHLAGPGASVREVVLTARASLPAADPPQTPDLLLDGLAVQFGEGQQAAIPVMRKALSAAARHSSAEPPDPAGQELRWLWLARTAAIRLWDDQAWDLLSGRHVQLVRQTGAISEFPLAVTARIYLHLATGELHVAESLISELRAAVDPAGGGLVSYAALGLAAIRGRKEEARALIEAAGADLAARGEGSGVSAAMWAAAVLGNGLGRYADALGAARQASRYPDEFGLAAWSRVELIEAAARTGQPGQAACALRSLAEATSASGTDWALGIQARSRALLTEGAAAEEHYQVAIERLGRTRVRLDLARAHLLYGEWLRRENRRADAREQLRSAHQMLQAMGAEGFAERARRELMATGETVRKRSVKTAAVLTAQELQISLRAREGRTNTEIGAELFLSPRTVEWHLRKVFGKLGITSRRELDRAIRDAGQAPALV
jgi:DNA-binding CsgD family transcriptional regulator